MFTAPGAVLRGLRALHRSGPRGRPPAVVVRPDGAAAVWSVAVAEVVVACRIPGPAVGAPVALPAAALAAGGPGDGPVAVAARGRRVTLSWTDAGRPRSQTFTAKRPGPRDALPPVPALAPVPAAFLTALHAAGRTAGRDPARYALHRVQVRGAAGGVAASDGAVLYRHGGFALPFADDVLVPAVPAVGPHLWRAADAVAVGLGDSHLVVRAGPWTAYPDVDRVIPPPTAAATLAAGEAAALARVLPTLPGRRDANQPVTLDLAPGRPAVVRGRDEATGAVAEHVLAAAPVAGGPVRAAVNRAFLARAARLGGQTIGVAGPRRFVAAAAGAVTWVTAGLSPDHVVDPGADSTPAAGPIVPPPHPSIPIRSTPMLPAESTACLLDRPAPAGPPTPWPRPRRSAPP